MKDALMEYCYSCKHYCASSFSMPCMLCIIQTIGSTPCNFEPVYSNKIDSVRLGSLPISAPSIKKIFFNGPATIIFWGDGTKTVVKCAKEDKFDPEKGVAMAICKKFLGNKYKSVFKDLPIYPDPLTVNLSFVDVISESIRNVSNILDSISIARNELDKENQK